MNSSLEAPKSMTMRGWITGLVIGGSLAACGSHSNPVADASMFTDVVADAYTVDANGGDTGHPDGALTDGAGDGATSDATDASTVPSQCTSPTAITAAPGADGASHVMGTISSTTDVVIGDVNNCTMGVQSGTLVYAYTMRTSAYLIASTDYPASDQALSTIVAILPTCSATAEPIACDDFSYWDPSYLSTTTTTMQIPMGTTVFIAVSGYDPASPSDMTGAFDLGVKEVQPTAVGAACSQFTACITSSDCLLTNTLPATNVCITEGAQGGLCVGAAGTCNTGLTCSDTSETCVSTAANGMPCDPAGNYVACAMNSTCTPVPTATSHTTYTCVADGVPGSACSSTGAACTGGSSCESSNGNLCQTSVAAGGMCDLFGQTTSCPSNDVCAPTSATMATCLGVTLVPAGTHATPATAVAPVTATTVYSGAITSATDVDCFGVTVSMGHSLYLETEQPGGPVCDPTMLSDTLLTLYNPAGMSIASNNFETPASDCSRIDPLTTMAAANLPAGTYTVCVGSTLGPITPATNVPYTLTIGVE